MSKILINVRLSKDIIEKMDKLVQNKSSSRPDLISELIEKNFDFTDNLEFKIKSIVNEIIEKNKESQKIKTSTISIKTKNKDFH